jgi:broad specificity phosphatase PhoE
MERHNQLPVDVIFVRHGESEANLLQKAEKANRLHDLPLQLRERPDWQHRLTDKGIEQAKVAGKWLLENGVDLSTFDARYNSVFLRARETAGYVADPNLPWRPHNMIHEQDWGEYGAIPHSEQEARFPHTYRMRKTASLYARLDGGESKADDVTLRVRQFRDTLREKWSNKRVAVVAHGGYIGVARYVFERQLPEDWDTMDNDDSQELGNCAVVWYTKRNPVKPDDVRPYLNWRLMAQPDDLSKSPFGGEWCELPDRRFMTGTELIASADNIPRLVNNQL